MFRFAYRQWLTPIINNLDSLKLDRSTLCAASIVFLTLSFSSPAFSDQNGLERFRVRGFGTLAITKSGDDDLYYPYYLSKDSTFGDDTSWDESLLGLQLDASITESFEASVQLVFRDRFDDSLEEQIERAFVKYSNKGLLVRVGRLGLDVYMLSEYRSVGYAYPWAHAPLEFYGAFGMESYNGAEVGYTFQTERGYFQASIYGGETSQTSEFLGLVIELDYESLVGSTLSYSQDDWTVRAAVTKATFASDIAQISTLRDALDSSSFLWADATTISDDLDIVGTSVTYSSIGALYDDGDWLVQSELSYADIETEAFPTFYTGYLSLAHRFDSLTPFIVGGFIEPDDRSVTSDAPSGYVLEQLQSAVSSFYDMTFDQKSLSFGLRWDALNNMSLTAQWDRSWVEANGGGLWTFDSINTEAVTLDTYSLSCSFIF